MAEFARRCRDVVVRSSRALTEGSVRLGQWMDWGRDYFTFSDTNIEYIWRFLREMYERGYLYKGHRSTEWCPRCGTSISQHELTQSGVYQERTDPSLFVRFPLLDHPGESLVIWTTTPWTLPANVAAAVQPEADYGLRENGEWVAVARYPDDAFVRTVKGSDLVGLRYRGPFDDLGPGSEVEHRVIPWDDVSLEEGSGIVHIAPGAGQEDFELGRIHDLPVLAPVDEAGHFYDAYGWLHGLSTTESADQIVGRLAETGFLLEAGTYEHRYPHCWRCDTPLIWRVTDDWLIAVDELRQPLLDANATVEWTPAYMGKRMDDWLRNMGDWNISRRRYYGLPLPIYECECGHVTVVGSKAELAERAVSGLEQLEELRRPWIDEVPIRCEACAETVRRIPEVGDVWLDAGIVPFSTLGWENPERVPEGYATGAAKGLTTADLPDHAYWEEWFPADWVSEMREQIRLWFYSQHFMAVALTGRAPYRRVLGYEKMLDETGREMHSSWGNTIDAPDAFARMGADVMRWQYCSQPPDRNLLFGFGPAHEIQRKLLTLWNSCKFLVDYANVEGWTPDWDDLASGPSGELEPLDRWLVERTHALVAEATAGYESWLTVDVVRAYEAFVDDVSNWYIRRSRRRFWDGDPVALATLWYALVQGLRVVAPLMPFLTDHLWRVLTAPCEGAPASVHLAGWPEAVEPDAALLAEIAELRRVVELGRQARATSGLKLRQPLRALVVEGAPLAGGSRGRDRGRAARPRGLVRARRSERAARQAEPSAPRPEAREGARRRSRGAPGRRLRGASGGWDSRRRSRAVARRGARRAARQGRLGGRRVGRAHGRARPPPRRRARARRARLRPHPRREHDAQGGRPRAHRSDRAHDSRGRRRPARARGLDRTRDARGLGRRRRRARPRQGLTARRMLSRWLGAVTARQRSRESSATARGARRRLRSEARRVLPRRRRRRAPSAAGCRGTCPSGAFASASGTRAATARSSGLARRGGGGSTRRRSSRRALASRRRSLLRRSPTR